jgi:hypothetical protein
MLKLDRGALPITEVPLVIYTEILKNTKPIFKNSMVVISQETMLGTTLNRLWEIIAENSTEAKLLKAKKLTYYLPDVRNLRGEDLEKLKLRK